MPLELSPLYPILDAAYLPAVTDHASGAEWHSSSVQAADQDRQRFLTGVVQALSAAGITILQYRNKHDSDAQVLRDATWLRQQAPASLRILLNDRVHLVNEAGCDGAHIGQTDIAPERARSMLGPDRILGLSTHNEAHLLAGDATTADYLAVGPVYATGSKPDAEQAIGLRGVQQARQLTAKPLVAIGGITLARATEVHAVGADSLAVIAALFGAPQAGQANSPAQVGKLAEDFLQLFR